MIKRRLYVLSVEDEELNIGQIEQRLARTFPSGCKVKPIESEWQASESLCRAVLESSPDCVKLLDEKGRLLYMNQNGRRLMEIDDFESWQGGEWEGLWSETEKTLVRGAIEKALRGETARFQAFCRTTKGKAKWWDVIVSPIENSGDNHARLVAVSRDITEQKSAEARLKESEERYRAFIEQTTEGIWCFEMEQPISSELPVEEQVELLTRNGVLAECNDAMARMYGFDCPADMLGKRLGELLAEDPVNYQTAVQFVSSGYRLTEAETVEFDSEGRKKTFLNNLVGIGENGKLLRTWGTMRDITASKQVEQFRRQSENHFRDLADNVPVLIWVFGPDKKCTYMNQRWLNFTGRKLEEELGNGWTEDIHPEDLDYCIATCGTAFDRRVAFEMELRLRTHDGKYRWMLAMGVPRFLPDGSFAGFMGSCLDITERKLAEQALHESELQMRQAQKMEAIGKLSGGIAHDFNNLLAVIMLQIDMLNLQLAPDSMLRYRVNEIKSAVNRASGLTKQLLAFSRKQMLQPRAVNLNNVVKDMGKMLRRLIGEDIELQFEIENDLGVCLVDPDQMSQVLMNLAVNSRDAMPDGGVLKIQTAKVHLDEHNCRKDASQRPGTYVELTVSDTGHGMDERTLDRIFEPFFTTKESGKGTGLGLSTVYGIIKQSGGFVWATSEPGNGTSFKIQLPVINDPIDISHAPDSSPPILIGKETILLVEDEKLIRRAALEVLRMLGYQVLEASNGEEALELARGYDKPIHLLLTDIVMPKMNGKDLSERLKKERPEIGILFMSGYTDDIIARHGVLEEGTMFLQKPFTPSALVQKVRDTIKAAKS